MTRPDPGDLYDMLHAVVHPDGTRALLAFLARRTGGTVMLLGAGGEPDAIVPEGPPPQEYRAASEEIRRVLSGRADAATAAGPGWRVHVTGSSGGPAVLVTSRTPITSASSALIAHVMALIRVRRAADERDIAVARTREVILGLLMGKREAGREPHVIRTARSLAAGGQPGLGGLIRVCLIDVPPSRQKAAAAACEAAVGARAWIIPGPVFCRDVIAVVADADAGEPAGPLVAALRRACPDAAIGAGGIVALEDTGEGWRQAMHALAVARSRPARTARYAEPGSLAEVLDSRARWWARRRLENLTTYKPSWSRGAPDAADLEDTLRAWLAFGSQAARRMVLSRNGARGRLDKVAGLLGTELVDSGVSRLPERAEIYLALQLLDYPAAPGGSDEPVPEFDEVLRQPAAADWAALILDPLSGPLLETVRAWVTAPTAARGEHAAAVTGVTTRTVYHRLEVAEQKLGRPITGDLPAKYDLYLALRIAGKAGPPR